VRAGDLEPDACTAFRRVASERRTVGEATGVVMHTHSCDAPRAQELLQHRAAAMGVSVPVLAAYVVECRALSH
jgi:hypothetical protein